MITLSGDWEGMALPEGATAVLAGGVKVGVPAEDGRAFYKFVIPAWQDRNTLSGPHLV